MLRAAIVTLVLSVCLCAQERARPRVALVLGGGGARGAAHVGVIEVLEELHVPVDYVVGTSMGAIVGGLYAVGYAPDEMADILAQADWLTILSDDPPRDDLWFRRRQDDRRFQVDLEFGWKDGGPALPPGLILGRNVEGFLEQLTLPVSGVHDFDQLRIPFRCVATDVGDGSAVVFTSGSLAKAIRASMSLPGIFAPVEHEGRHLVDGGVVDNVPIDVARELGADVVIAVDVSTPLADPATLRSLLGVSNQVIGILMDVNRRQSMESLGPDDIGMIPDLGDLTTMDFERALDAVELGRATAEANRDALAALAVDESSWRAWLERQRRPDVPKSVVHELRIDNRSNLSDRVIREFATIREGETLDSEALASTRRQLAGLGVLERIEIDLEPVPDAPGQTDVVLRPVEKDWGPHYLRFGLAATSDLRGSGDFAFGVQHTWTPINSWGGEWRNEVEIGSRTRLFTEFYQPLDPGLRWFVAPSIEFEQRELPLIVQRQKLASVNVEAVDFALSAGRNLGSWGEIRTGYRWITGSARPEISLPGLLPPRTDIETGEVFARFLVDTLDDVRFPHSGVIGSVSWSFRDEQFGGDERRSLVSGLLGVPVTFGDFTVFPSVEGGSTIEGDTPLGAEFFLGGFQRLSGLEPLELSGSHYALGIVRSYYRLAEATTKFGTSVYVGGSVEVGGIWPTRDDVSTDSLIVAGSAFVAADTILGPAYFALGMADGGERAAYVFVGPTF